MVRIECNIREVQIQLKELVSIVIIAYIHKVHSRSLQRLTNKTVGSRQGVLRPSPGVAPPPAPAPLPPTLDPDAPPLFPRVSNWYHFSTLGIVSSKGRLLIGMSKVPSLRLPPCSLATAFVY